MYLAFTQKVKKFELIRKFLIIQHNNKIEILKRRKIKRKILKILKTIGSYLTKSGRESKFSPQNYTCQKM